MTDPTPPAVLLLALVPSPNTWTLFNLSPRPMVYIAAYIFFCDSIRARVREANKEKKMTELSGIMAQEWKALGEEDKKVRDENGCGVL